MNCPICSTSLAPTQHEQIMVDSCPDHHGIWLTSDSLRAIAEGRLEDRSEAEEDDALAKGGSANMATVGEGSVHCPECGEVMNKLMYAYESGVVIDVCKEHGIWLDSGELERIEAWIEGNERDLAKDIATWAPKLDKIEYDYERQAAKNVGSAHWGPVRWAAEHLTWWWYRKDNL